MGYYTGSGVVTSYTDQISNVGTALVGATLNLFRRDIRTVTVKNGVQLPSSKESSSSSITSGNCTWSGYSYPFPVRNGSFTSVAYSRIGDSNLYVLTTEVDSFSSRINDGSWNA